MPRPTSTSCLPSNIELARLAETQVVEDTPKSGGRQRGGRLSFRGINTKMKSISKLSNSSSAVSALKPKKCGKGPKSYSDSEEHPCLMDSFEKFDKLMGGAICYSTPSYHELPNTEVLLPPFSNVESVTIFSPEDPAPVCPGDARAGTGARGIKIGKRAYGRTISTYPHLPNRGQREGSPVADQFCVQEQRYSDGVNAGGHAMTLVCLADGCNWGQKARLAALKALEGFMDYMNEWQDKIVDLSDAGHHLFLAFDSAHHNIIKDVEDMYDAGTTTLLGGMIIKLSQTQHSGVRKSHSFNEVPSKSRENFSKGNSHAVQSQKSDPFTSTAYSDSLCEHDDDQPPTIILPPSSTSPTSTIAFLCASVGDCRAFHYSGRTQTVTDITPTRETTRDASDPGGRLGPYHKPGGEPDLRNLKLSLIKCEVGDLLIIVSDGVTDNFDPVHMGYEFSTATGHYEKGPLCNPSPRTFMHDIATLNARCGFELDSPFSLEAGLANGSVGRKSLTVSEVEQLLPRSKQAESHDWKKGEREAQSTCIREFFLHFIKLAETLRHRIPSDIRKEKKEEKEKDEKDEREKEKEKEDRLITLKLELKEKEKEREKNGGSKEKDEERKREKQKEKLASPKSDQRERERERNGGKDKALSPKQERNGARRGSEDKRTAPRKLKKIDIQSCDDVGRRVVECESAPTPGGKGGSELLALPTNPVEKKKSSPELFVSSASPAVSPAVVRRSRGDSNRHSRDRLRRKDEGKDVRRRSRKGGGDTLKRGAEAGRGAPPPLPCVPLPRDVAELVLQHCMDVTHTSRDFLLRNPNKRLPKDYINFPGKMDHTTCVCLRVEDIP